MSSENVYAVIDLGTCEIRGLAACKLPSGEVSPIAYETVPSEGCVRHGAVYNIDEAATKIRAIVDKLNEQLEDNYFIEKLYVGVNAQSLRSEEEIIECSLNAAGEEITDSHIQSIFHKIETLDYTRRKIVYAAMPYYRVDGKFEEFPRSIVAHKLEAHVTLLTIKDWIYNNICTVVENRLGLKLAGILPNPLCEAHIALSESQKRLGCVYVNIGAGCTSVCVFADGQLKRLRVIPMGGDNVTKDLEFLRFTTEEAEKMKINYVSASTYMDRDKSIVGTDFDGVTERTIKVLDLNRVAAGRMKEIIANVAEVVDKSGVNKSIDIGYVFTGGGSKIKKLSDRIHEITKTYTFNTHYLRYLDNNNALSDVPELFTAYALAYAASENCQGIKVSSIEDLFAEPTKEVTPAIDKTEQPASLPAPEKGDLFSGLLQDDEPNEETYDEQEEYDFDDEELDDEKPGKKKEKEGRNGRTFLNKVNKWVQVTFNNANDDEEEGDELQ